MPAPQTRPALPPFSSSHCEDEIREDLYSGGPLGMLEKRPEPPVVPGSPLLRGLAPGSVPLAPHEPRGFPWFEVGAKAGVILPSGTPPGGVSSPRESTPARCCLLSLGA